MTNQNESLVECSHCLLKIKKNSAIIEENEKGEKLYFCCSGCHSVYHFVKDGGLEKFYEIRKDYKPGQVKRIKVTEELFLDDIKKVDDNCFEISLFVSDIRCAACIWLIENSLSKIKGIKYVRVNYATHKMVIQYDPMKIELNRILDTITNLGYCPVPIGMSSTNELMENEKRDYFIRFGVASFFSMQLMLYSVALYAGYFQGIDENLKKMFTFITFLLTTPVIFYSGKPFIVNSIKSLNNRTLNMDVLIVLGSFSAYLYSIYAMFSGLEVYFDSAAMIITLILLGRFIEATIKVKASKELLVLKGLQPINVKKVDPLEIDLEIDELTGIVYNIKDINAGDFIIVYEDEIIPLDGTIVKGSTEVDEATLTGESIPVVKKGGDVVYSGTKNILGKIVIKVENSFKESVVAKIVDAIENAQQATFKVQKRIDKIISIFVPTVIAISGLTFILWFHYNGNLEVSLMNAVSILVITCPCALGIAIPLALMLSTNIAAKHGIVIKKGDIIEDIEGIKKIYFDKTGTITEGKLAISKVQMVSNIDESKLLCYVASLEKYSKHPVARTVVDYYDGEAVEIKNVNEVAGRGIKGEALDGCEITIGNLKFLNDESIVVEKNILDEVGSSQYEGYIVIFVAINKILAAVLFLKDKLKDDAEGSLKYLKSVGIDINLLTGDNEQSTLSTLDKVKYLLNIKTSLTPFEKSDIIAKDHDNGVKNIFIGDGVNDAPAIKSADVGIAMGSGSELAIEIADAVILNNKLSSVVKLVRLVKYTNKTIKWNLFWAFFYNILMIPLAALGYLHPIISAGFMSISSLIVVLNSVGLKLRRL